MSAIPAVLIDSDCLHRLYLRGTLLRLATFRFFKPRWTQKILDDAANSLRERGVVTDEGLKKLIYVFGKLYPDAIVKEDYSHLIGTLKNVHPGDEHVLAAAIIGKVDAIVTGNIGDFPKDTFDKYKIKIPHPDDFLMNQVGLNPSGVLIAIAAQIRDYSKPELDAAQFAQCLKDASCPKFADFVLQNSEEIDNLVKTP